MAMNQVSSFNYFMLYTCKEEDFNIYDWKQGRLSYNAATWYPLVVY